MKLLLIVLLSCSVALGDPKCDKALSACDLLVQEQDQSITNLKRQVSTLEERLKDEQTPPILSTPMVLLIGIIVGGVSTLYIVKH